MSVPTVPSPPDRESIRRAADLRVGDRVAADFLPLSADLPADVLFLRRFEQRGERWVFVAFVQTDGFHDSTTFLADSVLRVLSPDPTGLDFSREADDPTPVSPARVPLHVGDVQSQILNDGRLVGEPGTGLRITRLAA